MSDVGSIDECAHVVWRGATVPDRYLYNIVGTKLPDKVGKAMIHGAT